ncbi:pleurotolysin b [Moniliophthora roreri MCA 2997]|uniref:Pleurotolysin b n=1 Tax=Moniliophthora roreri (strain MCA 2997) TaxID=1381753 RepID=V2YIB5_MONRO|nr:pleurotolysin b [Moniliophthora roreri MCA 2997]
MASHRPNSLKRSWNQTTLLSLSRFQSLTLLGAAYSESSSYKNTESQKTILMTSRYMFPQGQIDFTVSGSGFVDAVQLNPEFLSAIDSALDKSTPPEKRDALYNGFQEYGQVFRDKVQIGGVLSAHTMDTFSKRN